MKIKTYMTSLIIASSIGFMPIPSQAEPSHMMSSNATAETSSDTHYGKGEVLTIDKKMQKIKLAHGPIQSLNWGPMQMFFFVEKPELLNDIKVGDTVNFSFIKAENGRFVVIGF